MRWRNGVMTASLPGSITPAASQMRMERDSLSDAHLVMIDVTNTHGPAQLPRSGYVQRSFAQPAACLQVRATLTPEPTKHEGRKPRASERHAVGCSEELARSLFFALFAQCFNICEILHAAAGPLVLHEVLSR